MKKRDKKCIEKHSKIDKMCGFYKRKGRSLILERKKSGRSLLLYKTKVWNEMRKKRIRVIFRVKKQECREKCDGKKGLEITKMSGKVPYMEECWGIMIKKLKKRGNGGHFRPPNQHYWPY